jgi:hypothetical protein
MPENDFRHMKIAFGCWLNLCRPRLDFDSWKWFSQNENAVGNGSVNFTVHWLDVRILIVDDDNHYPQSKKQHILDTAYLDAANTRPHHQFQTFKNQIPLLQHNITIWYSSTPILSKTSRPATLHNTNRTEPPCPANRNEPATDEPNRPYLRFPRTETNLNEPKPSCIYNYNYIYIYHISYINSI